MINTRVPQISKLRLKEKETLTHPQSVADLGLEPRTSDLSWAGSDW